MKLSVLSSSSSGNCYILQDESTALIIECGVRISEIKKALDYNLTKVVGCLVSHSHKDHSKSVEDMIDCGINVYADKSVFTGKTSKIIQPNKGYIVGQFKVYAFPVSHDVPCLGFLITHDKTGSILFLTDTFNCDYTFNNLSHILIECNYADDILERNISEGRISPAMRKRLLFSHMELQTTKTILLAHDLTQVNTITLIHLSSGNSDEKRFIEEISNATGKIVYSANRGLEINYNKQPY